MSLLSSTIQALNDYRKTRNALEDVSNGFASPETVALVSAVLKSRREELIKALMAEEPLTPNMLRELIVRLETE